MPARFLSPIPSTLVSIQRIKKMNETPDWRALSAYEQKLSEITFMVFGANVRFVLLYKQHKISYTYSIFWLLAIHTNIFVSDANGERVYCPLSECNEEVFFSSSSSEIVDSRRKSKGKCIRSFTETVLVVRMNERVTCVPKPIHFGAELCLCMLFFLLSIVRFASFDDVALFRLHLFKVQNPLNQKTAIVCSNIVVGKEFGVSVCINSGILCGTRNARGVFLIVGPIQNLKHTHTCWWLYCWCYCYSCLP